MLRSESADEEALLQGAACLGWRLLLRTKDTIVIQEGFLLFELIQLNKVKPKEFISLNCWRNYVQ